MCRTLRSVQLTYRTMNAVTDSVRLAEELAEVLRYPLRAGSARPQ
jgi:hypothetical protein